MFCPIFDLKRACFFGKLSSIMPNFQFLSEEDKFRVILCPTSELSTKVVNKYIRIMFNARDNIDDGVDINQSCYPTYTPPLIAALMITLTSFLTLMKQKPATPVLTLL